jgi:hypothetical protein
VKIGFWRLVVTLGKSDEQVANDSLGVRAAFAGSTRGEIGHGAFENVPDLRAVKNVTLDEGIQKAGKDRAAGNGRPDGANSHVYGGHGE